VTAAETFDVVVVGYGYAGAVAAITAHDSGARVLLLEKQPDPGGISVCSAGGLRITDDADAAFAYLQATNAGTTPDPVLRRLADGMAGLPAAAETLCAAVGATLGVRRSPANYPLPGQASFGFAYVDAIEDFDPATTYPAVRGAVAGARLFEVVRRNIARRPGITVRLATPAERLIVADGRVAGIVAAGATIRTDAVILAAGGFEADVAFQRQVWPMTPVLSAASRTNTGDGLRMGAGIGGQLWHLWHYHGSYGFRHPDPDYPFGVRVKRLPDWDPTEGLRDDVVMSWILLDRAGKRFMNEYEPYMQDTGHRPFEAYDPVRQDFARIPALMLLDAPGRARYPISAPTWHDRDVAARHAGQTPRDFDAAILSTFDSLAEVAAHFGIAPAVLEASVAAWNAACAAGADAAFGRPPGSMAPITTPPFSAASVYPIVSNTQGGLAHDAEQRVLDVFGAPIPGLWVAGELGSTFGHLYMSGGNIAECFVGGRIAGANAASGGRA
jgi:succinate dehydrogenase/fumarate reductase flavoprotein subunit